MKKVRSLAKNGMHVNIDSNKIGTAKQNLTLVFQRDNQRVYRVDKASGALAPSRPETQISIHSIAN